MRILFVCQGNTCRSPIAEGLVRKYGGGLVQATSAGVRPGTRLAEETRQVMEEVGVDLSDHAPRPLEAVEEPIHFVVSLCEVIAPGQDLFPQAARLRWRIADPIGGTLDQYRFARNHIWAYLRPLLERLTENPDLPQQLPDSRPESLLPEGSSS